LHEPRAPTRTAASCAIASASSSSTPITWPCVPSRRAIAIVTCPSPQPDVKRRRADRTARARKERHHGGLHHLSLAGQAPPISKPSAIV
jgi:hypothetical protein